MTEKKPFRVATPPSQGAMEPIRLETARWYKKLREEHPAILGRVHQFMAGDILVHQGETVEGPMAYLVVEGMLAEKQTHFTIDRGHVNITLFHVSPGSIAFAQALAPKFASQPSFTTVVAETDGEALLLDPDQISRGFGKYGFLLSAQFRLQSQLLVSIWHQKLAYAKNAEAEPSVVSTRMANMKIMYQRELDEVKRLTQTIEGLETALKLAQMEASELRKFSPVAALEEERRLMTLRSLGTELYLDRLRREWTRACQNPHLLDFTDDESRLLMAEAPEGLAEIVQRVRSANQWDDDEIDAAIQLGVSPSRSTPPTPRNEVDELLTFAADADIAPVQYVKARPHISTIGFEDVDLASMRVEAAKPLVPHGTDIVSLDLEGGLPLGETGQALPPVDMPYRQRMRTLDYSEVAHVAQAAVEEDPDIEIIVEDDGDPSTKK